MELELISHFQGRERAPGWLAAASSWLLVYFFNSNSLEDTRDTEEETDSIIPEAQASVATTLIM